MFKRITELGDDHREVRRPTPLAEIAAVAERRRRGRGVHRPLRGTGKVVRHRLGGRGRGHLAREPHPPVAAAEELGPRRGRVAGRVPAAGRRRRSVGTRRGGSPPRSRPPDRVAVVDGRPTEPGVGRPLQPSLRARGPLPRSEPEGRPTTPRRCGGRDRRAGGAGARRRAARGVGEPPAEPGGPPAPHRDRPAAGGLVRQKQEPRPVGEHPRRPSRRIRTTEQDGLRLPAAEEALRQAMRTEKA